jgi:choline monooxygenase
VVLENSLESYHIPEVHPKTFVKYPDESACEHDLRPAASGFVTPTPRDRTAWLQDWMVRRLGQPVTACYTHKVLHPHVTFNGLDVYRMVQCVFPTGPDTCRYRAIMYSLAGPRRTPLARLIAWGLRPVSVAVAKKVYNEDAAIYAVVQKGLAASPHRGVIGTREERLYVFQQFVLDKCGQTAGPDPAAEANGCGGCPAAAGCAVP